MFSVCVCVCVLYMCVCVQAMFGLEDPKSDMVSWIQGHARAAHSFMARIAHWAYALQETVGLATSEPTEFFVGATGGVRIDVVGTPVFNQHG